MAHPTSVAVVFAHQPGPDLAGQASSAPNHSGPLLWLALVLLVVALHRLRQALRPIAPIVKVVLSAVFAAALMVASLIVIVVALTTHVGPSGG